MGVVYTYVVIVTHTDAAVNGAQSDLLQSTAGRKVKVVRLRQQSSVEDQGATEF